MSAARPGLTLPPGKTRYPLYRRLGAEVPRGFQEVKIPRLHYYYYYLLPSLHVAVYIFHDCWLNHVTYINVVIIINMNIICIVDIFRERFVFPPFTVLVTILPHCLLIHFYWFT